MARKPLPPAPANHDRWLISYADLLTLLLALFVVLFASSQLDKRKAMQVSNAVTAAFGTGGGRAQGVGNPSPSPVAVPETKIVVPELSPVFEHLQQALAEEIRLGKVALRLDPR